CRRAGEFEREHVAQPIPGEARLLAWRAVAICVLPVRIVIDALLIRRREAEGRQLGIGLDAAGRVHVRTEHMCHVGVTADEVMAEVRANGTSGYHGAAQRWDR